MHYDHKVRDGFWQERWRLANAFRWKNDPSMEPLYVLEMFPYTSGRMHIGHARNYSMGDSLARLYRSRGYDVLYPMGWDAFGLPAENAAIKFKTHPGKFTADATASMTSAMKQFGLGYSWENEISTCSPRYIRAQQQLFIELFRKGLIYRSDAYVYWDPIEQTVLASEQVIDGRGWRSGALVTKRRVAQWFFDIRSYADELVDGLDGLDGWPDSVKNIQRAWIGRSDGVEVDFNVVGSSQSIVVFTSRADTLAGVTFIGLAPEHPALDWLQPDKARTAEVRAFQRDILMQSAEDRAKLEKRGVNTGLLATNPLTGDQLPIFVCNYVTADYGTGAIMGVPSHDERDFEFARVQGLNGRRVVTPAPDSVVTNALVFEDDGLIVGSGPILDGLGSVEGRVAIAAHLEGLGRGRRSRQFRLQNWSISRQRYWGCPIPIAHCPSCGPQAVPVEQLPILLPSEINTDGQGSPLSRDGQWLKTKCPQCGGPATRDSDTMDTFVDSSWYFLRFPTPDADQPIETTVCNSIAPVDLYIGGVEHATLHLIYARFMTKALRDLGYINFGEPFVRLFNQGMVNDAMGRKQSKSLGNVTEPTEVISEYGADALRLYLLFKTSYNAPINWENSGPRSARQFLDRVMRLVTRHQGLLAARPERRFPVVDRVVTDSDLSLMRATHVAVDKVTRDVEKLSFNTAIAAVMSLTNAIYVDEKTVSGEVLSGSIRALIRILGIFAPHIAEEMWAMAGHDSLLVFEPWPTVESARVQAPTIVIPVQMNGRLIATLKVDPQIDEDDLLNTAMGDDDVIRRLGNRTVKAHRYVKGRVINLVVD